MYLEEEFSFTFNTDSFIDEDPITYSLEVYLKDSSEYYQIL